MTEQLTPGAVVATGEYRIDRDRLVRYAGASGDFNPIHYRDDVATSVGLPGVLAHGMVTMGLAIQPVVDRFGVARILDYQVRFTRPVPVPPQGDVLLQVEAKVARIDEQAGRARIDLVATVGGATVLGKAQVMIALGPPPPEAPHDA